MSLSKWFDEICIFQPKEETFHFYIGTPDKPRSSLVILEGNEIKQPRRVPPLSLELLKNRYRGFEIEEKDLYQISKFLLNLFRKFNFNIKHLDSIKLKTLDQENDPSILFVTDIKNYLSHLEIWKDSSIIPMNSDLNEWLNSDKINDNEEILYFIKILSHPVGIYRQQALTALVKKRTEMSNILISILLQRRLELDISVLRELARQKYNHPLASHLAFKWQLSDDKIRRYYSKLFLLYFHKKMLQNQKWYMERELLKQKQLLKSLFQRRKEIYSKLLDKQPKSSKALFEINLLYDTEMELSDLVLFLINSNWNKVNPANFRSALMNVVKFTEFVNIPNLAGVILAFSFIERKTVVGSNIDRNLGPMGYELNYIVRRINSLMKIWEETNQENKVVIAIFSMLKFYPRERLELNEPITSEIVRKWIDNHPVFSRYQHILDDISSKKSKVVELAPYLLKNGNKILQKWLALSVVDISVDKIEFSYLLPMATYFEDIIKLNENYFRENQIEMIQEYDYGNTESLLQFSNKYKIPISKSIFSDLIHIYLTSKVIPLQIIIEYLNTTGRDHKPLIIKYFNILKDLITPEMVKKPTEKEKNLIVKLLIPWSEITGVFPSDDQQEFIDALKIIYQEEIEDFDLETSRPLSVETIIEVYRLTRGLIPRFVEANIQFSFTKPVWEQMARHYLAMGLQRPKREAIRDSKLKDIPRYLTRDVLGQIAIVNQTITYCQRNGFRAPLENLIIDNLYRRGWNVERRLERTIPALFGGISSRLRSYLAAYLVIESGEVGNDVLKLARDVEEYQLRNRLIRELDRYATSDMWITIAEAYHPDITKIAIRKLTETRMSEIQRSKTTRNLILSHHIELRKMGKTWLEKFGVQQEDAFILLSASYSDTWEIILDYILKSNYQLTDAQQDSLKDLILRIMWTPNLNNKIREMAMDAIHLISGRASKSLEISLKNLFSAENDKIKGIAIQALARMEEKL